jgi:WD40 repeat protein
MDRLCYHELGELSMKRAETFWQALVLFLVFLMAVGIYTMLAWALQRFRGSDWESGTLPLSGANEAVQIVEPLDRTVVRHGAPLVVRAAVAEEDCRQAELQVDGVIVGVEVNPSLSSSPWVAEWIWAGVDEGIHELVVQAHDSEGEVETSSPVTVTVVPTGQVVFASNRDGVHAVYVMQSDGQDLSRLTSGPGSTTQPTLSKKGMLAFVAETENDLSMIKWAKASDEAAVDLISGRDPDWSPDGTHLAYAASLEGVSQVFVVEVPGTFPLPMTHEKVYAGQPAWSSDGTRLAYVAEREGNLDVWSMDLEGGVPRRLTDDPAMDWAPAWSPDGSRLAFVSNRGGSHQIYTMQADGTDVRSLTNFPKGAEAPVWSPKGYWLAFVAYAGAGAGGNAREIYLMRADGQTPVRLTFNRSEDTEPDWAWMP